MSYHTSPPTIDDEFASLFLKPMTNTPNNQQLVNHSPNNSESKEHNHADLDYLNSFEFPQQAETLSIGHADYTRYLPVETTLSNTLFDFADFSYCAPPTNASTSQSLNSKAANFATLKSNSDLVNAFQLPTRTNFPYNTFSEKGNSSVQQNHPQIKRQKLDNLEKKGVQSDALTHIANSVLRLKNIEENNEISLKSTTGSCISVDFEARLFGRLFVSPEVVRKPSEELLQTTTLYSYRRNSIAVNLTLKLNHRDNVERPLDTNCKKIILEIYNSLRKVDIKSEIHKIIRLEERIEFDFLKGTENTKDDKVYIRQSKFEIEMDSLKDKTELDLVWDQIRFVSATANNKHDAVKFNVIICKATFLNAEDSVLQTKLFESNPIVSRGRNPSFYVGKNEVMIGKIKRNTNAQQTGFSSEALPQVTKREVGSDVTKESPVSDLAPMTTELDDGFSNQTPKPEPEQAENPTPSQVSSYTYFKVDDHYYLPPVDVGYFPHHVHHNKQVFKSFVAPEKNQSGKVRKYNYYI